MKFICKTAVFVVLNRKKVLWNIYRIFSQALINLIVWFLHNIFGLCFVLKCFLLQKRHSIGSIFLILWTTLVFFCSHIRASTVFFCKQSHFKSITINFNIISTFYLFLSAFVDFTFVVSLPWTSKKSTFRQGKQTAINVSSLNFLYDYKNLFRFVAIWKDRDYVSL